MVSVAVWIDVTSASSVDLGGVGSVSVPRRSGAIFGVNSLKDFDTHFSNKTVLQRYIVFISEPQLILILEQT